MVAVIFSTKIPIAITIDARNVSSFLPPPNPDQPKPRKKHNMIYMQTTPQMKDIELSLAGWQTHCLKNSNPKAQA